MAEVAEGPGAAGLWAVDEPLPTESLVLGKALAMALHKAHSEGRVDLH